MPVAISVQSVADGMSTAPPESVITSGVMVMVAPVSAASSRYVQGPDATAPVTVTSTPEAVMMSGVMTTVGDTPPSSVAVTPDAVMMSGVMVTEALTMTAASSRYVHGPAT